MHQCVLHGVAGCVLHCVHGQAEAPGGGGLQLYIRPGQRRRKILYVLGDRGIRVRKETVTRSRIHEHTILLRFPGIILRVLNLESS